MVSEIGLHAKGRTLDYMIDSNCPHDKCRMCYVKNIQYAGLPIKKTTEEIEKDLDSINDQGYSIFLITREILNRPDWKALIKKSKQRHILTTGLPITRNPRLLDEIIEAGVNQMVFTVNLPDVSKKLILPEYNIIKRAVKFTNARGLKTMLTMMVTTANYAKVEEMAELAKETGVTNLRFLSYIPFSDEEYVLTHEQTNSFLESLYALQDSGKYSKDELYFSREIAGSSHKRGDICTAGDDRIVVGEDNYIYPCIFLIKPEFVIGELKDKSIELYREYKSKVPSCNQGFCKAAEFYRRK